jgi:hypothetical protein
MPRKKQIAGSNHATLDPPSKEQTVILDHLSKKRNVVVDACAGSGKSTTILSAAVRFSKKRFLIITYNSMLREEMCAKVQWMGIAANLEVHTFHSFCRSYYFREDYTDSGIRKTVDAHLPPIKPLPAFDVLVLDEAQDISLLYFKLVVKMTMERARPFQLMLLGDYKQSLYEFKGSDTRFLTRAPMHWRAHPYLVTNRFDLCTLKTSYRITIPMSHFVNHVMLGEERLEAVKEGVPVTYIRGDYRRIKNLVSTRIQELVRSGESPGDIFVLAGGTKRAGSLLREIENVLVESNIPCYIPSIAESDKIDPKVIDRKVVFTTFHSVKGRQRKYVFVADFNQRYFKIHGRNLDTRECPNTLYVGCTRATKELYLLELSRYSTDRPLDFLKYNMAEIAKMDYVDFKGIPQTIFPPEVEKPIEENETVCNVSPTDMVAFINDSVLSIVTPLVDALFVTEHEAEVVDESEEIPSMIRTLAGHYEDVSDLNGIAIPSMYYDHLSLHYMRDMEDPADPDHAGVCPIGFTILQELIQWSLQDMRPNEHTYLREFAKHVPLECQSPADYLFLTNVYLAVKDKIYFRIKQIDRDEYHWIPDEAIQRCISILDDTIGREIDTQSPPLIEYPIIDYSMREKNARIQDYLAPFLPPDFKKKFVFSARTDIITRDSVWEIKCTSQLVIEHKLQLLIYYWIWKIVYSNDGSSDKCAKLINLKTGERWVARASLDQLTAIIVPLLLGKYEDPVMKPDAEFDQITAAVIHSMANQYKHISLP